MVQSPRKILLIDDSLGDRAMFRYYLEQAPNVAYEVHEEELGEAGLAAFQRFQPDCVLIDYQLPDLSALEVLVRLRGENKELPCAVVILTGWGDEEVAVEAMKQGAKDYLPKNKITQETLWRAITHAIEKTELEQAVAARQRALEKSNQDLQRAMETLDRARAELEQRVLERTAELTQANERLCTQAEVLENMVEGVVVTTRNGTIFFTNRALDAMFGYDRGDLLGQPVSVFYVGTPETIEQMNAQILAHLQTYGVWRGELQNRKKDGTLITIYARMSIVELGREKYIVAVQEDITERKRLEAELRERGRLTIIGTTAVNLTHEIGNRLNSMSTTLQILERQLARQSTPLDAVGTETLQDLRTEIDRLRVTLQDIRMLTNLHQLSLQPLDVAALTADIVQNQASVFAEQGIRIDQQFPRDLPRALADWEKLSQVILNLCTNAVEAMPHGGTLVFRGRAVEGRILLEVQDTGEGIPADVDIFEAFSTTKPGGTGLGLTIVRHLIIAHNGTITYTSALGQGTTFILTLPIAPSVTKNSEPQLPSPTSLGRQQTQTHRVNRQS